jgi:hypothetical protein
VAACAHKGNTPVGASPFELPLTGNAVKIVVVKTELGYAPDPGDHGMGTMVAT